MESNSPLISIVIPTYNRRHLLPDAIESVRRQTFDDWELIVVDDGSTDGTRSYLTSLRDRRIRTVFQKHCGNIATVRNVGIEVSRGAMIAFLDSDDMFIRECLEMHVTQLMLNPDSGWSYGHHQLVDATGQDPGRQYKAPMETSRTGVLLAIMKGHTVPHTGSVMIRRALLEEVGPFDETLPLAEDFDLWLRLALVSPGVVIDATMVNVREHPDRTTKHIPDMALGKAAVFAKLKERVREDDLRHWCDRLRGEQLIHHATALSRQNHPFRAMRVLATAARLRGVPYSWWTTLGKVVLRPIVRRGIRTRDTTTTRD